VGECGDARRQEVVMKLEAIVVASVLLCACTSEDRHVEVGSGGASGGVGGSAGSGGASGAGAAGAAAGGVGGAGMAGSDAGKACLCCMWPACYGHVTEPACEGDTNCYWIVAAERCMDSGCFTNGDRNGCEVSGCTWACPSVQSVDTCNVNPSSGEVPVCTAANQDFGCHGI
jgi:hypothetical protein